MMYGHLSKNRPASLVIYIFIWMVGSSTEVANSEQVELLSVLRPPACSLKADFSVTRDELAQLRTRVEAIELNGLSLQQILEQDSLQQVDDKAVILKSDDLASPTYLIPLIDPEKANLEIGHEKFRFLLVGEEGIEPIILEFGLESVHDGNRATLAITDIAGSEKYVLDISGGFSYWESMDSSTIQEKGTNEVLACLWSALVSSFPGTPADLLCVWEPLVISCVAGGFSNACISNVVQTLLTIACQTEFNAIVCLSEAGSSSDITPPRIVDFSPSNGSTVQTPLSVSCRASDASGISRIDLRLDGGFVASCSSSTCSGSIAASLIPGDHYLTCSVIDANHLGSSVTHTVRVADTSSKDIVIENLNVSPSSVAAGSSVSISWNVRNAGTSTITESYQEDIYLSRDSSLGSSDVLLGRSHNHSSRLSPGDTHPGSGSFTIPTGTSSGTYHILVLGDARGNVSESSESNNLSSRTVSVTGGGSGKDIVIENLNVSPSSVAAGSSISVSWNVRNAGTSTITESYQEDIYLSRDSSLGSSDVLLGRSHNHSSRLSPGDTHPGSGSFTIPTGTSSGTYHILVLGDARGNVSESSEGNNLSSRTVSITGGGGSGKDIVIENLNVSPSSVTAGTAVTVSWNIRNIGTSTITESYQEDVYLSTNSTLGSSDTLIARSHEHTPDISPGGSHSLSGSLTIPSGIPPGGYYLIVEGDARGNVMETNENNNLRATFLTVR